MGTGSVIWGLSTVALPVAGAAVSLFLLRMIFGFGQSALIPANATSISRGFGSKERARAVSVAFSGNQVGLVVGAIIAAFLLDRWGWPSVFYCLGGASFDQHRQALMGCQEQPLRGWGSHPLRHLNSLLSLGPYVSHFR